jgi:hypothetical protein
LFKEDGYAAQGFCTSPIVANIAILPCIEQFIDYLDHIYPRAYALTIYADDVQLSLNSEDYEEYYNNERVFKEIVEARGFQINPKKTRTRLAKGGARRILGVNVTEEAVVASRKTKRKLRAAKHQANHASARGLTTWSRCYLPKSYLADQMAAKGKTQTGGFAEATLNEPIGTRTLGELMAELLVAPELLVASEAPPIRGIEEEVHRVPLDGTVGNRTLRELSLQQLMGLQPPVTHQASVMIEDTVNEPMGSTTLGEPEAPTITNRILLWDNRWHIVTPSDIAPE